jgi:sugar-phosphatase
LVIEDTVNGMIAGLAAKMKVIAIPEEINKNDQRFLVATKILNSLEEVSKVEPFD